MRSVKLAAATLVIAALPLGSAMADTFWRNIISSGATTASTYLTFRHDHKLIVAAQDDAGSYIASDGAIRGPYLEAALQAAQRQPGPAGQRHGTGQRDPRRRRAVRRPAVGPGDLASARRRGHSR